jgi:glycosyltransferase involved in cell wall biosynthesis
VSALADGSRAVAASTPKTVIAAVYPLAAGVAQFNGAMARAMARTAPVDVVSWRRLYPPLVYRGQVLDPSTAPAALPRASFILSWHDPRTWRDALRRVVDFDSRVVVLPWLHPVMTPPYQYLLRHMPKRVTRVVICHNVMPHEPVPGARWLSRAALRHADLLVTHAPQQREELRALGLASTPVLEAFHPRFEPQDFAQAPGEHERAAERARHGSPDLLLLTFGAIRPYKGVDIALDALALVDPELRVRLVVAGRCWGSGSALREQAQRLGLDGRVEFRDRFVPNEEAALLFSVADASLLPYRSATQSGVVQLSFAYGRPVIATRVGGLPAAVNDGVDGLLVEPDAESLAGAIETMASRHAELRAGVRAAGQATSFERYCALLDQRIVELRS